MELRIFGLFTLGSLIFFLSACGKDRLFESDDINEPILREFNLFQLDTSIQAKIVRTLIIKSKLLEIEYCG